MRTNKAPDKALAASLALTALTGTLAIWPPKLEQIQASHLRAVTTGDVTALYWDDEEDEDDDDGYDIFGAVAVVDVSGVLLPTSSWWMRYLGYRSTPEIAEAIRAAGDDANIKTIVLKVESPGGHVQGIAELADTVKEVGAKKRIITYSSGMCCSCAYWVASQTARIYSSRLADVGCIGTLFVVSDWSKYFADMGVEVNAITSTGAETYKGAGTFGTTLTPKQKADFKRICDESQVHFTAAVAAGRFAGDTKKATALATGQVHVGPAAMALGLVDEIVPDTFDAWLSRVSGADGVDYDPDDDTDPPTDDNSDLDDPLTTAAQSGRENPTMTFMEKLAAFLKGEGVGIEETPAATAAETELEQFRAQARERDIAEATRIEARRDAVKKTAITAFGTTNPAGLAAMQTAITAAPDEATLTGLEAACKHVTPPAYGQTARSSHGQAIDGEPADGSDSGNAPGVVGVDTPGIYAKRAQAMAGKGWS